jgi:ABC-type bacteriocin/lantibiotic exporter with double-glycine peptidase domain
MYNTSYIFLPTSIALFATVPQMFDMSIEKIGFGALLFFIIWTYMKHVMPKTQEEIARKNERVAELIEEIRRLNTMREQDQKTIAHLLNVRPSPHDTGRFQVANDEIDEL